MTLNNKTTTEQLIKQVSWAFLAQMILTSVHHLYGGIVCDSGLRSSMPIFATFELLTVLSLLFWYRRTQSGVALTLFTVVIAFVGAVQGLFHAIYGHAYKDALFLMGIPADQVRNFSFPYYPTISFIPRTMFSLS